MSRWLGVSVLAFVLVACTAEPECDADTDCDDGDVCTEDRCRLELCSNLAITHCCHAARPCPNSDLSACDLDAAPEPDVGRCVACLTDDDCEDPDFGACLHDPWPVCVECIIDADCSTDEACMSFACVPRGPPPPGGPCVEDADCASDWCLREADTGFPGGMCGQACAGPEDCLTGQCIDAFGHGMTCLGPCLPPPNCPPDTFCPPDCRPEYMCNGPACVPHCTDPSHCPAVGSCDRYSGLCTTVPTPGALNGEPCSTDVDCKGFCATEADTGAAGGLCATFCADSRRDCPGTDGCMYLLGPFAEGATLCQPVFDFVACRPAYAPQIAAVLPPDQPEWDGAPVCLPACQDTDCASGVCDEYTGICNAPPNPTGRDFGEPCVTHADCKGSCMFLWHEGYCTGPCIVGGSACNDGAVCMNLGVITMCGEPCTDPSECREPEYTCNPTFQACLQP